MGAARRADDVLVEERLAGQIGRLQGGELSFLVLDVIGPGAGSGQGQLAFGDLGGLVGGAGGIFSIVELVLADRAGIKGEGLAHLVGAVPGCARIGAGLIELGDGDFQSFLARLGLQFRQQPGGGVRLRLLLRIGLALNVGVDLHQRRPGLDHLALMGHHPDHLTGNLRIEAHIGAAVLIALDQARRIDGVGIGTGGGLESRLQRVDGVI